MDVKALFEQWRTSFAAGGAVFRQYLLGAVDVDAEINLCHPLGQLYGAEALFELAYLKLFTAMPDVERRDLIILAGLTPEGQHWLASMGNYMGVFIAPFLQIPATGRLAHMRFHEFFRFEQGKVVEIQAIWDIPELMVQANAWPMAPQLGNFMCTPAPMSGDGLRLDGDGSKSLKWVLAMLEDMCRHPMDPDPKSMQLARYWHRQMNWYGPTGIGSMRGLSGFRHWHQIPFLRAMPDRRLDAAAQLHSHWLAEANYVAETGWPNMRLTLKNHGWMGIAPSHQEILIRSLDFWRLEQSKQLQALTIRENWVLVDILDVYAQIGVDVLDRMREFNKTRHLSAVELSNDYV